MICCPGLGDPANGMSVVAGMLQGDPRWAGENIVHGAWLAETWRACLAFGRYVRMPHGAYDPVRLGYHGWRKRLVGPVERAFLRRAACVLATCPEEREWILAYEPRVKRIEVVDLKRYFRMDARPPRAAVRTPLRLLYLGRRHPLKGLAYLDRAVAAADRPVELRAESAVFAAAKEAAFAWCDALVLPTLSENFGLVVAEALARGVRVITTDGAPAWRGETYGGKLTYLAGYRDGTASRRVALLVAAIRSLADNLV